MKGNDRIIFAIGLAALALLLSGLFPTIGLTHDSHLYLKLASRFSEMGLAQQSFGSKPPLYPILLWTLQNNLILVSVFNALCWIGSMVLAFRILHDQIDNVFYKTSFAILIFFSTPIIMVHNFVWTEPPFILCVFLFLHFQINPTKSNNLNIIVGALLLVNMVALKHLGIGLVGGIGLVVWWKEQDFKKAFVLCCPAVLFFIIWLGYSYQLRGDFSRLDHSNGLNLWQNIEWVGQTFLHWFQPFALPTLISYFLYFLVLSFLVFEIKKADHQKALYQIIPIILILIVTTKADLLHADLERYFALAYPLMFALLLTKIAKTTIANQIWIRIPIILFIGYAIVRALKNGWMWQHT